MNRTIGKPYFTYTMCNAFTTEIDAKCLRCEGFGMMKRRGNTVCFRCTDCGYTKSKDLRVYRCSVHNQCKRCGRYYRVEIHDPKKQHFAAVHISCPYCGMVMSGRVEKTENPFSYAHSPERNGREPFFGLELWFLTSFHGRPVWAFNREHLAYLIDYLGADLREKPHGTAKRTQADHLPTFMKTAKNRERIVKLLKKLQEE